MENNEQNSKELFLNEINKEIGNIKKSLSTKKR